MRQVSADLRRVEFAAERAREAYLAEHPAVALINNVAAALMEIIAPMLWAALILMTLRAELRLG